MLAVIACIAITIISMAAIARRREDWYHIYL